MKKVFLTIALVLVGLASCKKEDIKPTMPAINVTEDHTVKVLCLPGTTDHITYFCGTNPEATFYTLSHFEISDSSASLYYGRTIIGINDGGYLNLDILTDPSILPTYRAIIIIDEDTVFNYTGNETLISYQHQF